MHLIRSFSLIMMVGACFVGTNAYASEREYKIEAAYIYNFLNYVTWPNLATPQELINPVICLRGEEAIQPYLEYMSQKAADGRDIILRRLSPTDTLKDCHIFYSGRTVNESITHDAAANGTLLVVHNEMPGQSANGMIDLVETEGRVVMRISQSRLNSSGFQVSSRLLSLAEKIE